MAALAIVVLAAARAIAPRVPDRSPGRGVHTIARTTSWLLVLAAVPALPIRYGLGFGAPHTSVAGAAILFAVATRLGARDALARTQVRPAHWLLQMTAVALAGPCTAAPAMLVDVDHTETRLLLAGSAGFLGALLVCARLDRPGAQDDANPPALAGPDTRQPEGPNMPDTT